MGALSVSEKENVAPLTHTSPEERLSWIARPTRIKRSLPTRLTRPEP